MPQLSIYTAEDAIRPEIVREIRALLASEWPDSDGEPASGPLVDPALHPVFFVLTSGERVLSYGRTIWASGELEDQTLKVHGLGDVITAPESRRAGYAGRIVEAATAYIRSDPNADLGILLTAPRLESWYGRQGLGPRAGFSRRDGRLRERIRARALSDDTAALGRHAYGASPAFAVHTRASRRRVVTGGFS